jgi:multidrug efflux system membrane fusion protein
VVDENRTEKKYMGSWRKYAIIGVIALLGVVALWQFTRAGASEPKGDRKARAVPVTTAAVAVKSLPIALRAIGQVEASSTVNVHAQVGGQITRIAFKEGDFVRKGDVLFGVDPRTSQTDVAAAQASYERAIASQKQAEANLARDQAVARNAAAEAKRYQQLVEGGVVSRSQYDQVRTTAEAAAAAVQATEGAVNSERKAVAAAKAVLDAAKVQLGFTTITAPVAGKTGALQAHLGDVVSANGQTPLVVINQLAPINAVFSIPEADFVRLKQAAPNGANGAGAAGTVAVQAAPAADPSALSDGTLNFVDNTVDPTTGTIRLKATFPNADQRLWPGQFVNVTVTLGVESSAVVVPSEAVQTGQQGQYVFVVLPDNTVEMRPVQISRTVEGDAIVSSGLQPGERVVTDGQMKLTPGTAVEEAGAPGVVPAGKGGGRS